MCERSQEARETELGSKDKSKAKRRKLERAAAAVEIKEKNQLPKDAFRVEHLNYKVRLQPALRCDLPNSSATHS